MGGLLTEIEKAGGCKKYSISSIRCHVSSRRKEKKKVGFWSLVVDVSLLIFSCLFCFLLLFGDSKTHVLKRTNHGRDVSEFATFFFCTLLTAISNSGALSSATTVTVCVTCRFLFAMLFPYCILSLTPLSHSFYLVYVIILVFCLASAMSLYNCLAALIGEIPFGQCRYCMPLDFYKVSFG